MGICEMIEQQPRAWDYVRSLRNKYKHGYAVLCFKMASHGCELPHNPYPELSTMAAQAVRMNINALMVTTGAEE